MKTKLDRILITVLSVLLFTECKLYSQDFSTLDNDFNDRSFKLFLRNTRVKPGSDKSYGGFTINGSLCMNNEDKGGTRVRYENPTLGDLIFVLGRLINGKPVTTESGLEHSYGGGFIGWMQYYKNVIATDKFLLSPGISFGDYIFGIEQLDSNNNRVMYDPAGYFLAGGPGIMASYAIGKGFWVDGYVNYDLSFAKVKYSRANYTPVADYPKPHFITYGVDLNHRSGAFFGVKFNQVIDRGNIHIKALRMDFSLGWHFDDYS